VEGSSGRNELCSNARFNIPGLWGCISLPWPVVIWGSRIGYSRRQSSIKFIHYCPRQMKIKIFHILVKVRSSFPRTENSGEDENELPVSSITADLCVKDSTVTPSLSYSSSWSLLHAHDSDTRTFSLCRQIAEGFFVLLFWSFSQQLLQNWLYCFVSTKTDNISELSRFTGIWRGQENFSQAASFRVNTRD
jgi:hypothetical protein